jgi:predicted negative regulator of RcsB-dependent stress response
MAIDELLDEHEQSERVRDWLRRNGGGLIGGVVLGLALIGGWQWWQQRQQGARIAAGERFSTVVQHLDAKNLKKAQPEVAAMVKDGGTYAVLASLQLAKAQVEAGQRDAAIATLRAVQGESDAMAVVVRTRLAHLLIDAGKAQEALEVLGNPEGAAALEARGDALFALGKREEARAAYTQALAKLDVASPIRRLVELKLTEAGGTPARPEAKI